MRWIWMMMIITLGCRAPERPPAPSLMPEIHEAYSMAQSLNEMEQRLDEIAHQALYREQLSEWVGMRQRDLHREWQPCWILRASIETPEPVIYINGKVISRRIHHAQ